MFFYDLNFCVDFIYDLFIYVGFLDWFKVSASKMKEFHQFLLVFASFWKFREKVRWKSFKKKKNIKKKN